MNSLLWFKSRFNYLFFSKLRTNYLLKNFINIEARKCYTNKCLLYTRIVNCKNFYIVTYSVSFFGLFKDDETPEDKLITAIKRSILCINRQQYDKAEQMLHLALRMAQDLQSNDGITYVYDIMANLAMEREQFEKAEKLFVDVMRRMLADGVPTDSLKILHISSKIAYMAQQRGEMEKAKTGFLWTLAKLEECRKNMPDNLDVKELWALTTNWFGEWHMKEKNFKQALHCFKAAYDCFTEIHGDVTEEAITILNNLSVACTNMHLFEEARNYITKALQLAKTFNDKSHESVLLVNLGLTFLREGLTNEAKSNCSNAWKIGKTEKNEAVVEQAEYCLNEINKHIKNNS